MHPQKSLLLSLLLETPLYTQLNSSMVAVLSFIIPGITEDVRRSMGLLKTQSIFLIYPYFRHEE